MTPPTIQPSEPPREPVSVRFVEEMTGFIAFGETDVRRGARAGRRSGTRLTLHLGIRIEHARGFATDSVQGARMEGWVSCDALGGRELPIESGTFDLFFGDGVGHPLTLAGAKTVGGPP